MRGVLIAVRRAGAVLVVGVAALTLAGQAGADVYQAAAQAYRNSGQVTPCRFSNGQLEAALTQAPPDGVEYAGGLTLAIQATIERQASGACTHSHRAVSAPETSAETSPVTAGPPLPRSITSTSSAGLPLPFLLALWSIVIGAVGAAIGGLFRFGGWDPGWAQVIRHACGESGYRIAETWAAFRAWLRSSDRLGS